MTYCILIYSLIVTWLPRVTLVEVIELPKRVNSKEKKPKEYLLTNNRIVIDHFVSKKENDMILEYAKVLEPSMRTQTNGAQNLEGNELLHGLFGSSGKRAYNESRVRDIREIALVKNYIRVVKKMVEFTRKFFQVDMNLQTTYLGVRNPGAKYNIPFRRFNYSWWSHGVHVDRCDLVMSRNSVNCRKIPEASYDRQYTALLYISEYVHSNLVFIDLPKEHQYRRLTEIPPPSEAEIATARRRRLQELNIHEYTKNVGSSDKYINGTKSAGNSMDQGYQEPLLVKTGIHTVVPPAPGRLLVFSCTFSNVKIKLIYLIAFFLFYSGSREYAWRYRHRFQGETCAIDCLVHTSRQKGFW